MRLGVVSLLIHSYTYKQCPSECMCYQWCKQERTQLGSPRVHAGQKTGYTFMQCHFVCSHGLEVTVHSSLTILKFMAMPEMVSVQT